MLDKLLNSQPNLPSIRLLAVSGTTLEKWHGLFFKSSRHFPSAVCQFSKRQGLRRLESACYLLKPSPTGACRYGYEGLQRYSLAIAVFLGIAGLLFSSGCGVSNMTPSVGKTEVDAAVLEIYASVVFNGRASYQYIPLSRFGLTSSKCIETIVSSCECVKASLVRYSDSSTTTADGVLFEFVPDEPSPIEMPQPMQMGVVITLIMVGRETQTVTMNLRHAPATVLGDPSSKIGPVPVSISTKGDTTFSLHLGFRPEWQMRLPRPKA